MKIVNRKYLLLPTLFTLLTVTPVSAETLKDAVDDTIHGHPKIGANTFTILGRMEEIRQAKADYFPQIGLNGATGVQEIQEPVQETLYPNLLTLSLRQNIFNGFQTKGEVERQKARTVSSAYLLQGTADLMALRTTEVYLNVLRQQELLALVEEDLKTHQRISDQIRLRSDAGVSSSADEDQVSGRVALAETNVVNVRINLADANSNYLAVVGHLPEELQRPEADREDLPEDLDNAENKALRNHPVLKSANADLQARIKQHDVAKGAFYPILDLEVDQNWEEDYDTAGRNDALVALLRLRYNLFKGYRDEAREQETIFLIGEARDIRNDTQRQVIESIRLSWMAYQAVLQKIQLLEQRVTATVATAEAYNKQFNLGKRTLLDVLDTEAEVTDARRSLISAQYDGLYAHYRILNGMGVLVSSIGSTLPPEAIVDEQTEETYKQPKLDKKVEDLLPDKS